MTLSKVTVCSIALIFSSGAAFANVTQVACDKFVIAIATEIATAAEENAGSKTAAEEKICEAATQITVSGDDPEVHNIIILPYNIETTVVISPVD